MQKILTNCRIKNNKLHYQHRQLHSQHCTSISHSKPAGQWHTAKPAWTHWSTGPSKRKKKRKKMPGSSQPQRRVVTPNTHAQRPRPQPVDIRQTKEYKAASRRYFHLSWFCCDSALWELANMRGLDGYRRLWRCRFWCIRLMNCIIGVSPGRLLVFDKANVYSIWE